MYSTCACAWSSLQLETPFSSLSSDVLRMTRVVDHASGRPARILAMAEVGGGVGPLVNGIHGCLPVGRRGQAAVSCERPCAHLRLPNAVFTGTYMYTLY